MTGMPAKTYAIEDSGPYDEDEARKKIRAYCDEHGFQAALALKVVETTEGRETGRIIDPGKLLD
jgi:hypothetical protein